MIPFFWCSGTDVFYVDIRGNWENPIKDIYTGYRDKGAVFENLVYLKLKHKHLRYVYEGSNEIDFFTDDEALIEVKYNSVLNENQQKLFESYPAKERKVVDSAKAFIVL